MAISATGGNATNSASTSSLNLAAFTLTASQCVVVWIVLGSTSVSVSTVTDTKGNAYTLAAAINGTGIRCEVWKCLSVGAQSNNVIAIALSGTTSISAGQEEYAGVTAIGNTSTLAGSDANPFSYVLTQQAASFAFMAIGFATGSASDSLTIQTGMGTLRQSSIPAAASVVGSGSYDNTHAVEVGKIPVWAKLNAAYNWVAVGVELEGGGASNVYKALDDMPVALDSSGLLFVPSPTPSDISVW
jgi:hypothetical protein